MKKKCLFVLLGLSLSVVLSSCNGNEEEPQTSAKITLSAPVANASVSADADTDVTFEWSTTGSIGDCVLALSMSEKLTSAQTIAITGNSPLVVPARTFVEKVMALGIEEDFPTKIYWSVKPASATEKAETEVRAMTVTCSFPTIVLNSPANLTLIDGNNPSFPRTFSYTPVESIESYKIKFSLDDTFPAGATTTYDLTGNSYSMTEDGFNELMTGLGVTGSASTIVYWTVVAADEQLIVKNQVRSFTGRKSAFKNAKGSWLFDNAADLLEAAIGTALVKNGTITAIAGPGTNNKAVRIADDTETERSFIHAVHNIPANGNSAKNLVNEYTILMDFRIPDATTWRSLIHTDVHFAIDGASSRLMTTDNWGDGKSGLSFQGQAGMSSSNVIAPNTWYRLVLSSKCGVFWDVYVDGVKAMTGNVADYAQLDSEFSLQLDGVLFGTAGGWPGGPQIDVAQITIWGEALDSETIQVLGGVPAY